MRLFHTKPALVVLLLGLLSCLLGALAAWPLLLEPGLGVRLQASSSGDAVVVVQADTSQSGLPTQGAQLLRLMSATGSSMTLQASDLIEEPDFFDTYEAMDDFFARQSALSALLHEGAVTLIWRDVQGVEHQSVVVPQKRTLRSLPVTFWFQLTVGFSALLIAAWVVVLRPAHWGVRMFGLTGLAFPVFTTAAAIYSSRALALPGPEFRLLSSLNHAGANGFGCALVGLFLMYPSPLVRPRVLLWLVAVFGAWWLMDALHWAPDQNWGSRLPVMAQMVIALVCGWVQWRRSRNHPLDRAALRWFALSSLVSCSLFILLVYVPSMVGWFEPLPQAYAFGFFLLMYLGIALGLGKYRLFDLDEWAYRVWLWLMGVLAVVGMDAALLYAGVQQTWSLGVTLLLCGGVYFPFRQWLWQRLLARDTPKIETLLPQLSHIAFLPSGAAQQAAWSALLSELFEPLEQSPNAYAGAAASVQDDGLSLQVPACAGLSACTLRHAGRGAQLFATRHAHFTTGLCELLGEMVQGRSRYEQGVQQERLRIGRDLHDNIGARLLRLIHQLRGTPSAEVARDAIKDLRTSLAALDAHPVPLANALADWRAEAEARCEALDCQLHWQQPQDLPALELAPRSKAMLEAVLREIISNALKHAAPSEIRADFMLKGRHLSFSVANNGAVQALAQWKEGYGLRNIRSRLAEMGGELQVAVDASSVCLSVEVALS